MAQSLARELVLDDDTVTHPDLTDAPAGHLVGVSRHAHADDNTIAAVSAPGIFRPPAAVNEPIRSYAPGSPERAELQARLGRDVRRARPHPDGDRRRARRDGHHVRGRDAAPPRPRARRRREGRRRRGRARDRRRTRRAPRLVADALARACRDLPARRRADRRARGARRSTPRRCSTSRRPPTRPRSTRPARRSTSSASTPSTSSRIYEEQPVSSPGVWNRIEYRPLEGFVLAISPFNFTAIGANLTTSPALMGNTVVWKPASTQALSAWITMRILEEAGLPPGVINLVFGPGAEMGAAALASPELAGVHFTGSTGGLPVDLAHDRQRRRPLPQLPAHRRRDRRQGLHPRASVRRSRPRSRPRSCAARSSTRARSAPRRRGSTSRRTSGATCARRSSARSAASGSATSATSRTSWAP